MKTRWVKGRDTKKGRGPGSRHLPPRVGRVEEKKSRSRGKPRKAARDQSSQRVEGARSRCGGWQRSSMRLRRIEAEGAEMYFCACVEVGVSRGFSPLGEDRFQSLQRACAIVSLPLGKARRSRPLRPSLPGWRSNRVSAPASLRRAGAASNVVDTSKRQDLTLPPPRGRAPSRDAQYPLRWPPPLEVIESRLLPSRVYSRQPRGWCSRLFPGALPLRVPRARLLLHLLSLPMGVLITPCLRNLTVSYLTARSLEPPHQGPRSLSPLQRPPPSK